MYKKPYIIILLDKILLVQKIQKLFNRNKIDLRSHDFVTITEFGAINFDNEENRRNILPDQDIHVLQHQMKT